MAKALQGRKNAFAEYFFDARAARTRDMTAKSRDAQRLVRVAGGCDARAKRA